MEVLGDLIRLSPSGHLPLPWSMRAHLGLESETGVSVFLTQPEGQGVPDILITPLTPHNLLTTFSFELQVREEKGAVHSVLKRLDRDANIVISDTITLEGRTRHKLNLVIEPSRDELTAAEFKKKIKESLESVPTLFGKVTVKDIYDPKQGKLLERPPVRIADAYIPWPNWREIITTTSPYKEQAKKYDLTRVVVSSNPDQRLLRYVLPRKGVVQLEVPHHNLPRALQAITEKINDMNYNILSSRLSRTPRRPTTERMSAFVAVCEPNEDMSNASEKDIVESAKRLRDAVRQIDSKYIAANTKFGFGRSADGTRYLIPRNARNVLPPQHLLTLIEGYRRDAINKFREVHGRRPELLIFLSYRFVKGRLTDPRIQKEHADSLLAIRDAALSVDCHVLVGKPALRADTTAEAIYPAMWVGDACLVLALNEKGVGEPSLSQAHEYGMFMGARKRARILVSQERLRDGDTLGNLDGFVRITYADDPLAVRPGGAPGVPVGDHDHDESLYSRVRAFLKDMVEEKHGLEGEDPPLDSGLAEVFREPSSGDEDEQPIYGS
jgi:hypothetical protein